jgi:RNA polymerase sigma-70 factor, ECF subfamily
MLEEELIQRAKQGDLAAFQELVKEYYPLVERFAFQLGNRRDEIDDITQEVFVRVYRFFDHYSNGKFSTWLYKITLNVSRDIGRKKAQNERKLFKFKLEREEYPEVEATILTREEDRVLHLCIQRLDEKYRVPIVLFYFHDKRYEEIAEILNTSLSNVKTRLLRAKEKLKKLLEEAEKKGGLKHG